MLRLVLCTSDFAPIDRVKKVLAHVRIFWHGSLSERPVWWIACHKGDRLIVYYFGYTCCLCRNGVNLLCRSFALDRFIIITCRTSRFEQVSEEENLNWTFLLFRSNYHSNLSLHTAFFPVMCFCSNLVRDFRILFTPFLLPSSSEPEKNLMHRTYTNWIFLCQSHILQRYSAERTASLFSFFSSSSPILMRLVTDGYLVSCGGDVFDDDLALDPSFLRQSHHESRYLPEFLPKLPHFLHFLYQ